MDSQQKPQYSQYVYIFQELAWWDVVVKQGTHRNKGRTEDKSLYEKVNLLFAVCRSGHEQIRLSFSPAALSWSVNLLLLAQTNY